MCMADLPFGGEFTPAPNYCPSHPDFDMGIGATDSYGFYGYRHKCPQCIVAAIKRIPQDFASGFLGLHAPDPKTIELVLDVLDQKFGLT